MRNPYRPLEKSIGYRFRRRRHLETALTHRSFRFESDESLFDNQRLEYLGDAALGLVTAHQLFEHYPDFEEGDLTRVRSKLTNLKTLAILAARVDLGTYLRLGRGEHQSGGQQRTSNLGDALEAVIGAAFLDGGIRAVEKIFKKVFAPEMEPAARDRWTDNPKGLFQEMIQRQLRISPRYRIAHEEGPAHSKVFTIEVLVNGEVIGKGQGSNKRDAEMEAARAALTHFGKKDQTPPDPSP